MPTWYCSNCGREGGSQGCYVGNDPNSGFLCDPDFAERNKHREDGIGEMVRFALESGRVTGKRESER